jgi:hypothetical protein
MYGIFIGDFESRSGGALLWGTGTMDAAEYRQMAEHHLRCARQMTDPCARAALLDIAAYWMELAGRADQNCPVVQRPQVMRRHGSAA